MKCPKCNSAVTPGLLFCSECGFKIEDFPLCKECGMPLRDGVLFCPSCRTPSRSKDEVAAKADVTNATNNAAGTEVVNPLKAEDALEKTMTIPVVKPNTHRPSDTADSAGVDRVSSYSKSSFGGGLSGRGQNSSGSLNQNKAKSQKKEGKTKNSKKTLSRIQKNILIFLFVFIAVVFLGLAGIGAVIKVTHKKPIKNSREIGDKKVTVVNNVKKQGEEPGEVPSRRDYGSSRHVAVYEPLIDLNYDFARGINISDIVSPKNGDAMAVHENQDYFFVCPIPAGFVRESGGTVEVRYLAEDKTAYIDIGALKNTRNWSSESVRDAVIAKLGGTADYKSSDDGWFVVSVIKNGIYYYQKCMINEESIRYFEMVYPEEYSEIFSGCISEIEAGFRQVK